MRKILLAVMIAIAMLACSVSAASAQGVTQPVTYDGTHVFHQGVYLDSRIQCWTPYMGECRGYTDDRFSRDMAKLKEIGMHDAIATGIPHNGVLGTIRRQLEIAQANGVYLVLNIPYKTPTTTVDQVVNMAKYYAYEYGYYIADEPGQHPGEDFNTEKAAVVAMAQHIRALDANSNHRIFTVHFGCDRALMNTFQKPYAQQPIIDQAMGDCYPVVPGNDAPDGNGIDNIVFAAWDQVSINSINAGRQVPRVVGQFFSWHQDDLSKPVDWPTMGQVQRMRNCAVIAATSGIFYFNLDWAWDGPGYPNVPAGKAGRGEAYVNSVLKAAVQSPMDYSGSQRCVP